MHRRAIAVFVCVFLASASFFLHGCGGCDEDAAKDCMKSNTATGCDGMKKSVDCLKDCCDWEEDGAKVDKTIDSLVQIGAAMTPPCAIEDPC